jgi:hypothetical protein
MEGGSKEMQRKKGEKKTLARRELADSQNGVFLI